MKKMLMAAGMAAVMTACGTSAQKAATDAGNPFLAEYSTPFGVPPFDRIKVEHYKEAFLKGMEEQKKEIDAIVNQRSVPDFDNTIAAFDQSGELLNKVNTVFYGLNSCNTNDEMQALNKELTPLLSAHRDDISLNPALFARVKEVYERREQLGLDKEQNKLLEETYKKFVRGGANLDSVDQAKLRQLNSEISMLQLTFGQNLLKETNAFRLVIDKEEDLAGLPESLVASAAEAAKSEGLEGEWLFTLHNPSVMPFCNMQIIVSCVKKIFKDTSIVAIMVTRQTIMKL